MRTERFFTNPAVAILMKGEKAAMINWTMIYGKDSVVECTRCGSKLTYRKEPSFTRDYTAVLWVCLKCGKNMPAVPAKENGNEMDAAINTFKGRYERLLKENLSLFRQVLRLRKELKNRNTLLKRSGAEEGPFTPEEPHGSRPMEAGIPLHRQDRQPHVHHIVD